MGRMRTYVVESRVLAEVPTAVVFGEVEAGELGSWLPRALGSVARYLAQVGAGPLGMPFARMHVIEGEPMEVEAGFACLLPVDGDEEVEPSSLPGGPAAATWHVGRYAGLGEAYRALDAWIRDTGGEPAGAPWEVYHSDPLVDPDPTHWRTEVVQPYLLRPAGGAAGG